MSNREFLAWLLGRKNPRRVLPLIMGCLREETKGRAKRMSPNELRYVAMMQNMNQQQRNQYQGYFLPGFGLGGILYPRSWGDL